MTQVTDHSYASSVLACPRRHYYENERHLVRIEPNVPMIVGSAGHKALSILYKEGWQALPAATAAMLAYISEHGVHLPPLGEKYEYLTEGHLEVVLANYVDEWSAKETASVTSIIEEPIIAQLALGGAFAAVGGIPDLILHEGRYKVLDHKWTSGYLGNLYTRMKYTHQLRVYCLLIETIVGEPVYDGIINAIFFGKGASSASSKAQKFERWAFTYNDAQLSETRDWLLASGQLVDYFRATAGKREALWPQNAGSHCGHCDYAQLCETSGALREAKALTMYEVRPPQGRLLSGADDN